VTNFGAFVELHEGIEGLVHVSELDEKRIEKPEEAVKVGDVYAMKIIKINEGEKKIGLSIKAVKQDEYKQDLESYRESASAQQDLHRDRPRRRLPRRPGGEGARQGVDGGPKPQVISRPSESIA
jgi:predicted RNA-binding protein with RPS1 domain